MLTKRLIVIKMDISFDLYYNDKNVGAKTDVLRIIKRLCDHSNPFELPNTM